MRRPNYQAIVYNLPRRVTAAMRHAAGRVITSSSPCRRYEAALSLALCHGRAVGGGGGGRCPDPSPPRGYSGQSSAPALVATRPPII